MKLKPKDDVIVVRDKVIAEMIQALHTLMTNARDCTDRNDSNGAYLSHLQAYDQCKLILTTCKNRKKLSHIPLLTTKLCSICYDIGVVAFRIGLRDEAIKFTEESYNVQKNPHASFNLAVFHFNKKNYLKTAEYLLLDNNHKIFDQAGLHQVAVALDQQCKNNMQLLRNAIMFDEYLANNYNSNSTLPQSISKEALYEKIAQMYDHLGNVKKQLQWRLKAVELNHPMALHNYASMLCDGEGVKKNPQLAAEFYLKAAKLDHVDAMNDLGLMLFRGTEIPADLVQAEYWLSLAADKHDHVLAMCNLAGVLSQKLIFPIQPEQLPLKHRIEQYCSRGELEGNLEAKNVRAMLLCNECLSNNTPLDEVIEIYNELANKGLGSAQANLATIYHIRQPENWPTAIYWYLEAIRNGYDESKDNLFILIFAMAKQMADQPEKALKLFESVLKRYQNIIAKSHDKFDEFIDNATYMIEEITNGLRGDKTDFFNDLFPKHQVKLRKEILSINEQIEQKAEVRFLPASEKVKIILEYTLAAAKSPRNLTAALRSISRIVATKKQGWDALGENEQLFLELIERISQEKIDSDAFVELCVGLAKMKGHPDSRLFGACYDKLFEFMQANQNEYSWVNATTLTTLLNSISDLAVNHPLRDGIVTLCRQGYLQSADQLNPIQLIRSLHGLCVYHACAKEPQIRQECLQIILQIVQKLTQTNPQTLSPIDLHQAYLSGRYLRKNNLCGHEITSVFDRHFLSAFARLMSWLKKRKAIDVHSSNSQIELAEFLRKFRNDVEEEVLRNGLFVDIFLRQNEVIIHFDGPYHFLKGMPDESLEKIRRCKDIFHDAIHGIKSVRIVYDEQSAESNDNDRLTFLQKKLLPWGVQLQPVGENVTQTTSVQEHRIFDI